MLTRILGIAVGSLAFMAMSSEVRACRAQAAPNPLQSAATASAAQTTPEYAFVSAPDQSNALRRQIARNPAQAFWAIFDEERLTLVPENGNSGLADVSMELVGWGDDDESFPVSMKRHTVDGCRIEYDRGPLSEWYVNSPRGLKQGFTVAGPPPTVSGGSSLELILNVSGGLQPFAVAGDTIEFRDANGNTQYRYADVVSWDADGRMLNGRLELRDGGTIAIVIHTAGARFPITVDPILTAENVKLIASPPNVGGAFGYRVAISGNTAIVGSKNENAAYVFVQSGSSWTQQAKLTAADVSTFASFGQSVAIDGDIAIVGAPYDDHSGFDAAGSAHVFVRTGTSWVKQAKLISSDPDEQWLLGFSVSLSGDTALIGAPHGDNDGWFADGAAYVFVKTGSSWTQQAKLVPSDVALADYFGFAVSISGNTALIGSTGDDHGNKMNAGSAYAFVRNGSAWTQQAKLTAPDASNDDRFGLSVSIDGEVAVIGAPLDDHSGGFDAGSADVFVRSGSQWTHAQRLTASDAGHDHRFGYAVDIDNHVVLIGSPQANGAGWSDTGCVHVFAREGTCSIWSQQSKSKASDGAVGDEYGQSVGISGNRAIVGAYRDTHAGVLGSGSAYVLDVPAVTCSGAYVVRVSVKRVLSVSQLTPAGWGGLHAPNEIIDDWITKANSILTPRLGITLVVDEVVDLVDPGLFGSWFDVVLNNAADMEAAAENDPCRFRWRTDAINVYLVNSRTLIGSGGSDPKGGFAGFPWSPANDIVFLQKSILNGPVGVAHEIGHHFGLLHTHEDALGADVASPSVFPTFGCCALGDGICDTPADPGTITSYDVATLEAFYGCGSAFGCDSPIFKAIRYNVMSYYGGIDVADAVFTTGQRCRAQALLVAYRQNELIGSNIPRQQCAWSYLGKSKPGAFGSPLLEGVGTLLPGAGTSLTISGGKPSSAGVLVAGVVPWGQPFYGGLLVPYPSVVLPIATDVAGAMAMSFPWPAGIPAATSIYLQAWIQDDPQTDFGVSATNAIVAKTP